VRILANPQPELPWKLEAFDDKTNQPGYINFIRIADGVTVDEIHLNIVGDHGKHRKHGAAHVRQIDLVTNCGHPFTIERVDITGNLNELGPTWAGQLAGPCQIGRNVLHDLVFERLDGDFFCGGLSANLIVNGGTSDSPRISIGSSFSDPHQIEIEGSLGELGILGDAGGASTVHGDLERLQIGADGNRADLTGELTIDGALREGWIYGNVVRTLDVGVLPDLTLVGGGIPSSAVVSAADFIGTFFMETGILSGHVDMDHFYGQLTAGLIEGLGTIESSHERAARVTAVTGFTPQAEIRVAEDFWGQATALYGDFAGTFVVYGDMHGGLDTGYLEWPGATCNISGRVEVSRDLVYCLTRTWA
jgi:hypothetical protein